MDWEIYVLSSLAVFVANHENQRVRGPEIGGQTQAVQGSMGHMDSAP